MKKLIFSIILLGLFNLGFGQGIQLSYEGNVLEQDETLWVDGVLNDLLLFHGLEFKNVSGSTMNVKAKKTIIEEVPETLNYFCFGGLCFGPNTYVSPNFVELAPDESSVDFSGDYEPGEHSGTTTIAYTFFNESNENDSIRVIVKFMAFPVGVKDQLAGSMNISSIYPNPASDIAQVDYTFNQTFQNAKVVIYNLLGSVMDEVYLKNNHGKAILNTQGYDEGIYFYNIIVDNKVMKTEKLIIKR